MRATTPDYVFDDPNAGRIPREEFAAYFDVLRQAVEKLRGDVAEDRFMDLTEVVTSETDGGLTAWCWWSIPGTSIQGAGLIKVGPDGVRFERITYHTRLPAGA